MKFFSIGLSLFGLIAPGCKKNRAYRPEEKLMEATSGSVLPVPASQQWILASGSVEITTDAQDHRPFPRTISGFLVADDVLVTALHAKPQFPGLEGKSKEGLVGWQDVDQNRAIFRSSSAVLAGGAKDLRVVDAEEFPDFDAAVLKVEWKNAAGRRPVDQGVVRGFITAESELSANTPLIAVGYPVFASGNPQFPFGLAMTEGTFSKFTDVTFAENSQRFVASTVTANLEKFDFKSSTQSEPIKLSAAMGFSGSPVLVKDSSKVLSLVSHIKDGEARGPAFASLIASRKSHLLNAISTLSSFPSPSPSPSNSDASPPSVDVPETRSSDIGGDDD